jgi:nucleotide-binding universal stress UspA family protein
MRCAGVGQDGTMQAPVLVATHHSSTADHVVERAARLAVAVGAELHAVSVVPDLVVAAAVGSAGADALTRQADAERETCAQALARAAALGQEFGVEVTQHMVQGEAAAQIAYVADTIGADLIVLGSRGLDAAGRYVLGSVPERLLFDPHGHDVLVVRTTP